jgi:hypothetical protein
LTHRRTSNWKMVEEVTAALRRFDPKDPVKYDFGLSRLGILRQCLHRYDSTVCRRCPLVSHCSIGKAGRVLDKT